MVMFNCLKNLNFGDQTDWNKQKLKNALKESGMAMSTCV